MSLFKHLLETNNWLALTERADCNFVCLKGFENCQFISHLQADVVGQKKNWLNE